MKAPRHVFLLPLLVLLAAGVITVLLLPFGPPAQIATIIGLAGAGLTVALKDFVVGFFGWFVLLWQRATSS